MLSSAEGLRRSALRALSVCSLSRRDDGEMEWSVRRVGDDPLGEYVRTRGTKLIIFLLLFPLLPFSVFFL